MNNLRERFSERVWESVQTCRELGYDPFIFVEMLEGNHPVEVVKKLVVSGDVQYGFRKLIDMDRPDLTVEHIMLEPEFSPIFTEQELKAARWRLDNAQNF